MSDEVLEREEKNWTPREPKVTLEDILLDIMLWFTSGNRGAVLGKYLRSNSDIQRGIKYAVDR